MAVSCAERASRLPCPYTNGAIRIGITVRVLSPCANIRYWYGARSHSLGHRNVIEKTVGLPVDVMEVPVNGQ